MPQYSWWEESPLPRPGHLGGIVAQHVELLRRPTVVAYVTGIYAYRNGFAFTAGIEQATDVRPSHAAALASVEVGFADGRHIATDLGPHRLIAMRSTSSSGRGGASWKGTYWADGLPPIGPVTFMLVRDSVEGLGQIDGSTIIDAANRSIDLWVQ